MDTLGFLLMLFYTIITGAIAIIVSIAAISIVVLVATTIIDSIKEKFNNVR